MNLTNWNFTFQQPQTALDAYRQFVARCDEPARWRSAATYSGGLTFFAVYAMGIPLQLAVLPANARLAKQFSAFLLLLHIVSKLCKN
jgi:hypothetical protein